MAYAFDDKSNNTDSLLHSPQKLWVDSETTTNYVTPYLSFSKEKRFKWSSIYWPKNKDQELARRQRKRSQIVAVARKISKSIDNQQKNKLGQGQSLSMSKLQVGSIKKLPYETSPEKKSFRISRSNQIIVNRLAVNFQKLQSTLRDRYGNRSNLYQNPQQLSQRQRQKNIKKSTGFTTSRKFRLDLPYNYYPGPGTYKIKRYLCELDSKSEAFINDKRPIKTEKSQK